MGIDVSMFLVEWFYTLFTRAFSLELSLFLIFYIFLIHLIFQKENMGFVFILWRNNCHKSLNGNFLFGGEKINWERF